MKDLDKKSLMFSLLLSLSVVLVVVVTSCFLFNYDISEIDVTERRAYKLIQQTILVGALKDNHNTYLNNVWSTMGFLMLAIGWVVTSDKARNYWRSSNVARNVSLSAALIIMIFHITILYDIAYESEKLQALSQNLPVGASYYIITERMVLGSSIVNGSFFVLLWGLILLQTPKLLNAS